MGQTDMTKIIVAFQNFANGPETYIILLVVIILILLHCFIKGFLLTLGQLYFRQSSATRSRCLTQLHYAHSQVTNRGTNRILYLLVVDENGNELFPHEG